MFRQRISQNRERTENLVEMATDLRWGIYTLVVQRAALGLVEVEEWEPEAANPESRPVLAPASQNNSKELISRV